MPNRKAEELRELTDDDLKTKIAEHKQDLFALRFQHVTGELENSSRLGQLRKDIARMHTEWRHREIAAYEALEENS